MFKNPVIILLLIFLTLSKFSASAQNTVIWLVRHAEKETINPTERDPELSQLGLKRAADLGKVLQKEKISTIYSTNYKRTLATVTPLANALQLNPVTYNPKDAAATAGKVLQENKGKTALIVGHSNTIIPIIKALNYNVPLEELTDDDYDMLFKVVIDQSGKATVTISHYGAAHHTTDIQNKKAMTTPMN